MSRYDYDNDDIQSDIDAIDNSIFMIETWVKDHEIELEKLMNSDSPNKGQATTLIRQFRGIINQIQSDLN